MSKKKLTMTRDQKAHTPKGRPERVPFNQGSKLSVAKGIISPGYHGHWFIDKPGELESAKAAYYDYVMVKGKKYKTPAGNGFTHYLMQIEQKYYDDDMAKQQKMVTETTRNAVKVKKSQGEYSPEGEELSVTRDII